MVLPTVVNVVLALDPRVVMAAMHTTMIRASITAYSTAVGPSSFFRKLTSCLVRLRMFGSFVRVTNRVVGGSVRAPAARVPRLARSGHSAAGGGGGGRRLDGRADER